MAREAYRSLYGDLTKLKDDSLLKDPAAGSGDDDEMFQLLLAVSDWVDRYCNRRFYPRVQTLETDGSGGPRLPVPDLVSLASLTEDVDGDNTFSRDWKAEEYWLEPYDADPAEHWGRPYTSLRVGRPNPKVCFTKGERRFRAHGTWGYREFKERSGAVVDDAAVTPDGAAITVSDEAQFAVGQTIIIGAEQLLVAGIEENALSVTRGLNGTLPAAHPDGSGVYILRWPASVERAALIQAARIWTRAADFEPFYVDSDVDTDVRLLLEPYRKVLV
jgi:hypothetical protein